MDVDTPFGSTHVRISGQGDGIPLVLFHGLAGTSLSWHAVIAELARGRTVYAPDNIGTAGRSVQTAPVRAPQDIADWGVAVLDALDLTRAHLLGYSEGAWWAALVASAEGRNRSARIARLTLGEGITSLVKPSPQALRRLLSSAMLPTRRRMDAFNTWLSPGVQLTPQDVACATAALSYRRATPWPAPLSDAELAAIEAPVLGLFGAESRLGDPVAAGERLARHVRDADVHLVAGGGHGLLWQLPGEVLPRIRRFLVAHDG